MAAGPIAAFWLEGNFKKNSIQYWDGTNVYPIAGASPNTGPTLAQVNIGIVTAGVHQVAYSWQYATGYLSPPSPLGSINSTGTNDIEISGIPTPPVANIVGFVLLMSLANQLELFFVPNGSYSSTAISPRTTAIINSYDTSLLTSADYLNDIMTTVPTCAHFGFYNGRLVFVGRFDFPFIVLFSDVDLFDSINIINNVSNLPRDNASNVPSASLTINTILYILKPYGTYALIDNGLVPNTWSLIPIDASLGGHSSGISAFSSGLSGSDIFNTSFVIHPHGLMLFNGTYGDPALSYNIDALWRGITGLFTNLSLAHDITNKTLYILIPSINGLTNSAILVVDYTDGLNVTAVKWSVLVFNGVGGLFNFKNIAYVSDQSGNWFLALCATDGNIYGINPQQSYDLTPSFPIEIVTLFSPVSGEVGARTCFNGIRIRGYIVGSVDGASPNNLLQIQLRGEDASTNLFVTSVNTLKSGAFGGTLDFYRGTNAVSEKLFLVFIMFTLNNITFNRVDIFGETLFRLRTNPFTVISNIYSYAGGW